MQSTILLISILAAIGIAVYYFRNKIWVYIEQKLNEIFVNVSNKVTEQVISIAQQKLAADKQEIKTDLQNKENKFEDLVKRVGEELKENRSKLETAEKDRVGSFRAVEQELINQRRLTEQLATTTEGLKKVLSNNQLRGQFGEQVAEDLLKMTGFVHGTDYSKNKAQEGATTRPDFTVFLPDGVKINIDSKFPYSNLQKMTEFEDKESKNEYLKLFRKDIKDKIKQVTTRDYINPADNTVDFVVLFIPNEMIFSFIYEHMDDIWQEAMSQKVVLTGPFTFTAVLRLIRQSYSNFKYQKNVNKIINLITEFEEEFVKYNVEFKKIGERIEGLTKQYDEVDSTRSNKLVKTVEKIKIEEPKTTPLISESILAKNDLSKSEIEGGDKIE